MGTVSSTRRQVFNEINITPLTDIFLVLLIIMMVVAPMMQSFRQDIQPPEITNGSAVDPSRLTVQVTADGQYIYDDRTMTIEELGTELTGLLQSADLPKDDRNLVIRADGDTKSSAVIRLFGVARDAGFYKITVGGQNKRGVSSVKEQTDDPTVPSGIDPDEIF